MPEPRAQLHEDSSYEYDSYFHFHQFPVIMALGDVCNECSMDILLANYAKKESYEAYTGRCTGIWVSFQFAEFQFAEFQL